MVCVKQLLGDNPISPGTPFYYAKGKTEYEEYGLDQLAQASMGEGAYSQANFIQRGMAVISPLTQFKVLYNMPLSFISIDIGLTGDNAVLYSSLSGLRIQLEGARANISCLIGSGRVFTDGQVEAGFALITPDEMATLSIPYSIEEAVDFFRWLSGEGMDG